MSDAQPCFENTYWLFLHSMDMNDFAWDEVGIRIRNRRLGLQMSQHSLATAAGLTQNGIFKVECGETNPQLATLQSIAKALDCSVRDLIVGMTEGDQALAGPFQRVRRILESTDEVAIRVMETGFESAEALLDRGAHRGRRGLPPIRMKGDGRQSSAVELLWMQGPSTRGSELDAITTIEVDLKAGGTSRDATANSERPREQKPR
jgi:transcriptional regulator with XRE-family HTH domain